MSRSVDKRGWTRLAKIIDGLKNEQRGLIEISRVKGLKYELESLARNYETMEEDQLEHQGRIEEIEKLLNVSPGIYKPGRNQRPNTILD